MAALNKEVSQKLRVSNELIEIKKFWLTHLIVAKFDSLYMICIVN